MKLVLNGINVVITGRRQEVGQRSADTLNDKANGATCVFVQGDVGNADDCKSMVDETAKLGNGTLHYLFNNAAIGTTIPSLVDVPAEEIQNMLNVNIGGTIWCTKFAIPFMTEGGVIVNTSSTASALPRCVGNPNVFPATKAAVDAFTRQMVGQLAPKNINIFSVNPCVIRTDGLERFSDKVGQGDLVAKMAAGFNPSGKPGTPEEVADVVFAMFQGLTAYESGDSVITESGNTWNAQVMYEAMASKTLVKPKLEHAKDATGADNQHQQ
eukprot:TRINITY_DN46389_c0_g1_i1.p1 TRINITY_DN46389_c0_g1~~TRINITY_DN46389_c0_g1_i1.p1  ORF type:complete len:269 (+),score=24.37 TRINITY_DN46389_c0_g1_i1:83-889(+)